MMIPTVAVLSAVMLLAQPATQRGGDDDDKPLEQQKAELRKEAESEFQQLKPITAERVEDVVRFSIQGNDLALQTKLPQTEGYSRLNVSGLQGFSKVLVTKGTAPAAANAFNLIHQDFEPADAVIVLTTVFNVPQQLQVSRDEERLDERRNIQLIQSDQYTADGEGKVKLYINVSKKVSGEVIADLKLSAGNILELRRRYPVEVARYLEPIFRDFKQEAVLGQVDPKLAWQVFAPLYQPTAELGKKVQALAKQLDAEDFNLRESASKELAKMGAPAAIVLSRMPRGRMSEEQQTRLDALIAPINPLAEEEAARLRGDKFFLMDCLYCDELQIRQWALSQLQKVVGKQIAFNVQMPKAQRDEEISRLRLTLLSAATQPAR